MYDFLFNCLIRFLSGGKNAAYYGNKIRVADFIGTMLASIITLWAINREDSMNWPLFGLCLFPISIVFWMLIMFEYSSNKSIHTAEMLLTGSWSVIALAAGADWVAIICGSYFGNVLFNFPIQYVTTGKIVNKVSATDNPTGKTLGYNIFGTIINVPRISNGYVRLAIGLAFGLIYLLDYLFFHIHFYTKII